MSIQLNKDAILTAMQAELEKRLVRYHPEMLSQYVDMRLPVAKTRWLYGKLKTPKTEITDGTLKKWVDAFIGKYVNGEG